MCTLCQLSPVEEERLGNRGVGRDVDKNASLEGLRDENIEDDCGSVEVNTQQRSDEEKERWRERERETEGAHLRR